MKVLVTGGAGYIGSHTCVELINSSIDTVVLDNLCNSSEKSLDRVREITGTSPVFYKGDVRDEALLERIFSENEFDCVIHFAGLKCVPESVKKPAEYYENNLGSTLVLCKVMARHGCERLVFSSSATVYSAVNEMPLKEDSITGDCTNPYGWTKYMGERILTDIATADPEWAIALLRYFNPIGAHESGLIGEDPRGIPNNLMPFIAQVAVGRRERLTVFGGDYPTPDGTCRRDFIHVMDLAAGHRLAAEYAMEHTGAAAINLGTGRPYSVREVIAAFEQASGRAVPFVVGPRRPGDLPEFWADAGKAERLLGWRARYGLPEMCRDTWRWQQQNPQGYPGE